MDELVGFGLSTSAGPQASSDGLAELRRSWLVVAAETLPGDETLVRLLADGLAGAAPGGGPPPESALLQITEHAAQHAVGKGSADAARGLSKRLRRAIYEYFLSLDAASAAERISHDGHVQPAAGGDDPVAASTARVKGGNRPELVWDEPELRVIEGGSTSIDVAPPGITPPPADGVEPADPVAGAGPAAPGDGDAADPGPPPGDDPAGPAAGDQPDGAGGWGLRSLPARLWHRERSATWTFRTAPEAPVEDVPAQPAGEEAEDPASSTAEVTAGEISATLPPEQQPADAVTPDGEAPAGASPPATVAGEAAGPVDTDDAAAGEPEQAAGPSGAGAVAGDRPNLVVVDLAGGEGDGEGPGRGRQAELLRVPERFRRDHTTAPPPLVVPSYRAWADVLASSGDDADGELEQLSRRLAGPPPAAPSRPTPLPPLSPRPPSTGGLAARLRTVRPAPQDPGSREPAESFTPAEGPLPPAPPAGLRREGEDDGLTAVPATVPWVGGTGDPTFLALPVHPAPAPGPDAPPLDPGPPDPLFASLPGDRPATASGPTWTVAPRPEEPEFTPAGPTWQFQAPTALPLAEGWMPDPPPATAWPAYQERWPTPGPGSDWPRSQGGGSSPRPSVPTPVSEPVDDSGSWSVRRSPRQQALHERMAQRRRDEVIRAATVEFDEQAGRSRKGRGPELDRLRLPEQVEHLLRKKRGGEAAALIQRAAQELGGHEVAELALACGDRCRTLRQSRAAVNSYLAAWRADPLFETPLWRLAESCLADHETELAVGYLERVADLMRARGDDEAAMGVYRKIVTVAPERGDVRALVQAAQSLGRFPD